ncbi:MAG: NUDIX domain-containing protein [Bacilli bacterium]
MFLGGKIEENENSKEIIKRETLEEIGYEVDDLEFYTNFETYYEVLTQKLKIKLYLRKQKYTVMLLLIYILV